MFRPAGCERSQVLRVLRVPRWPRSHGASLDDRRRPLPLPHSFCPNPSSGSHLRRCRCGGDTRSANGPVACPKVACTARYPAHACFLAGPPCRLVFLDVPYLDLDRLYQTADIRQAKYQALRAGLLLLYSEGLSEQSWPWSPISSSSRLRSLCVTPPITTSPTTRRVRETAKKSRMLRHTRMTSCF